jgi:molybdate transport system ATP-binding protein
MIEARCRVERGALRLDVELVSAAPVIGIFGPSGSGKTSVLYAIAGLLRPTSGAIAVDGVLTDDPINDLQLPPHRRQIGFVFQENRLFPHWTVAQNLLAGYRLRKARAARMPLEAAIALLDLEPLLDRIPDSLSGGEQRRVAIARALLTSPRLLILDEPLTGLDARLRDSLLHYLQRLTQQLAVQILYVSHTLGDFLTLANVAAVVRDGTCRLIGSPEQLLDLYAGSAAETMEATLCGYVTAPGPDPGLMEVGLGRATVMTVGPALPRGTPVRLTLAASQVLLALPPLPALSIRNRLPARIVALHPTGGHALVALDMDGQRLFADVTLAAVRELALRPGLDVIACFKARAARLTAPASMSAAVDDIAQSGQQIQSSSAELSNLAERLKTLVGQFKV